MGVLLLGIHGMFNRLRIRGLNLMDAIGSGKTSITRSNQLQQRLQTLSLYYDGGSNYYLYSTIDVFHGLITRCILTFPTCHVKHS